jgi:hypothetical protein
VDSPILDRAPRPELIYLADLCARWRRFYERRTDDMTLRPFERSWARLRVRKLADDERELRSRAWA